MSRTNWSRQVLISSAITQAAIYVIRPMITYRALELDASAAEIGAIASIYALFPVLLALTFGKWVSRTGEGRFILFGTAAIGVSASLMLIAQNVYLLAFAAGLSGVAHLACMVGGQTMVSLKSPSDKYEHHFGLYTFSASLGQMVGPALATLVAGSSGVLPESTNKAFLLALFMSLVALIATWSWWREGPTVIQATRSEGTLKSALLLLKKPGIFTAIFTSLAISSSGDILIVFLPLYGSEHQFSAFAIGVIITLRAGASMISRFFLGRLSKRFSTHRLITVSNLISVSMCILMAFAPNPLTLAIVVTIAGLSIGVGQPLTMTMISQLTAPEDRALAVSTRLTGNRFGQFIVPAAAGVIAGSAGTGAVFIALAALLASTFAA